MESRVATNRKLLSADDVLDLPLPNGVSSFELVDGQPVPVMPASLLHGRLIAEVAYRLQHHVMTHHLPGTVFIDVGVVMALRRDPERMRGPDVVYIRNENLEGHDPERLFRGLPDLAIEIDLTSVKKPGGQRRILEYLEAGIPLVWAIDVHTRTAMAFRPDGSARLVRSDEALDAAEIVPGFRLELSELFG